MHDKIDIYDELYLSYREYINSRTTYAPKILKKTPQTIASFPTIILKEILNIDDSRGKTTNNYEFVDKRGYTVDIYTKDISNTASATIQKELKNLTFDFFYYLGFKRDGFQEAPFIDITVDRIIITFHGSVQSWNKKII